MIKVAIVDDHPMVVRGLQNMLSSTSIIELTGAYFSGVELLLGLAGNCPDVLLLDIQMPEQNGEELAPILHKKYPKMAILAFTNQEHPYYIKSMLKFGVMGYVLKTSRESILLEAIEAVSKGKHYFDPTVRLQALEALRPSNNRDTKIPVLTQREKEILKLIASRCSSVDIAAKLFLSKRTVDFHRTNLLVKFNVKNSLSLVQKAIEIGIIR